MPRPAVRVPAEQRPEPLGPGAAEVVETALGGLFFLLGLAVELGVVADFSAPADGAAGVDPWDVVTLLGTRLLGGPADDDPVWTLLAQLAGRRDDEPPGHAAHIDDAWRVPPEWLAPWGRAGWRWSSAGRRLRVLHPAGFLVLDVPGGDLERELAPYRAPRPRRGGLGRPPSRSPSAARWADRLAAYARPRLALALALRDHDAIAGLLLRRHARVIVAPANVEVVLSLSHHPVEIRLAGLDRDPGWIPSAGRSLTFTFL